MLSYKEYDNALAVEIVIKGFVSTQEFDDTAKKLAAFIARHGKVNVLEVIEDFEGMDGTAFWKDFKFSPTHLNDFSRCAIVSDGKWVTPWSEIVAPFLKGEVRYFPPDEVQAIPALEVRFVTLSGCRPRPPGGGEKFTGRCHRTEASLARNALF